MRKARKSSGRMASKGFPNPIDVHVGQRVRQRRTLLGMSQEKLAEAIGLTFQQVQKYERGANRVGSSRLFEIARVLDVPVSYFYEGMGTGGSISPAATGALPTTSKEIALDPMIKRETLELVRAYYKVGDTSIRKRLFALI